MWRPETQQSQQASQDKDATASEAMEPDDEVVVVDHEEVVPQESHDVQRGREVKDREDNKKGVEVEPRTAENSTGDGVGDNHEDTMMESGDKEENYEGMGVGRV